MRKITLDSWIVIMLLLFFFFAGSAGFSHMHYVEAENRYRHSLTTITFSEGKVLKDAGQNDRDIANGWSDAVIVSGVFTALTGAGLVTMVCIRRNRRVGEIKQENTGK